MSWPDEVMENYTHEQQRFRLVMIAFRQALANQGNPELKKGEFAPVEVAANIVEAADAVLAEMERIHDTAKNPTAAMEQTPDTGPSAEEVQEGIIEIDERRRCPCGRRKPNLAIVREIRAEIQTQLDADLEVHASSPSTNIRVGGYRDGGSDRSKMILAMIDAAIAKADAGLSADAIERPTRTEDGELLVD